MDVRKIAKTVRMPFQILLSAIEVIFFFVAYMLAVFPFLPFRLLVPRFYWFVEGMLYRSIQAFIGYWGYTAGYKGKSASLYRSL